MLPFQEYFNKIYKNKDLSFVVKRSKQLSALETLDQETLDFAIASLETPQALGRKVGVISHVPIMVERIGAKVVVEKQGGGRSSVVVVGGF